MINFFRKIRQKLLTENRLSRYLIYAVGEIVLVVIGILIALQINNWNIRRMEQSKIQVYVGSLIHDLEEDIIMSKFSMNQAIEVLRRVDSLTQYMQDRNIENISNLDILCLSSSLGYRPFSWNRATLDELKSSGSLQFIENDSLKMKIAKYDAFTHHLDQDYVIDLETSKNCSELISQIINKNYFNFKELYEVLRIYGSKPLHWEEHYLVYGSTKGFEFFSTPEYKIAKAQGLGLITNDIGEINRVINNLITLQLKLELRTKYELPKLIKNSEELITLLNELYLDQELYQISKN